MRILVINEYAGQLGGVEQYLANVVPALRSRGHTVGLHYLKDAPRNVDSFRALFDASWQNELATAVAQFQPDTLFLHRVEDIQEFLSLPQRKVRYIHDHDLCCPRRHKYYWFNGRACNHKADWRCWFDLAFLAKSPQGRLRFVSLADHRKQRELHKKLDLLLVGSRSMRQELEQNGLRQVEVIAPVIPLDASAAPPPIGRGHLLYVGQLIRGKGVDLLVQSLQKLQGTWQATLVGDGNARSALEQQIRSLGLENRVKVAGWVTPEELHSHYVQAQMVIVPSRWPEPFGMVGLEAMNYGRPVVGFDHGGIPDWLEHGLTGWLVKPYDVAGLTLALQSLLDKPELCQQLGHKGFLRVRERFEFENMVDRLERVLCP